MLKKLILENFQSHKKTVIRFSKGVTVIYGLSTTGKTAILRSLNWLIYNRPSGFRFKSHFARKKADTHARLWVDKYNIGRVRGRGKNGYYIAEGSTMLDEFEGMGSNVPDTVAEHLNIHSINIHSQLDSPFLITDSSGQISKTINRVTKLEKTDSWVSELTRNVNSTNRDIQNCDADVTEYKQTLKKYKNLPKVRDILGSHTTLLEECESLNEEIRDLNSVKAQINDITFNLEVKTAVEEAGKLLPKIDECEEEREEIVEQLRKIDWVKEMLLEIGEMKYDYGELVKEYVTGLEEQGECPICSQEITTECIDEIRRGL